MLFVVVALMGFLIVVFGEGFRVWGLALLLAATAYFAFIFSAGPRANAKVRRAQDTQRADAERWRQTLPENVVALSDDPLRAVRELTAQHNGGVYLGLTPDQREWTTAERQQAVLVLGPPRSGKTSALIIPSLLTAWGPAVSTSTKVDVLMATAAARSRNGRIWLFDPSGTEPVPSGVVELNWSPIHSSRTWDGARTMADAMVGASSAGSGVENASYWTESAKTLLAPLLHAAALSGVSIAEVRRWVSRMSLERAGEVLEAHGAEAAADDLAAIASTEERERSSIFSTARIVLGAYGSDAVAARSQRQNFDADRFVRSGDTVYITAPSHMQNTLAPLVVGLLEEIRNSTYALARAQSRGQAPRTAPVFWALDEIANIAPIKKLPAIVSEAGGQGLQIMACFQDLSQARSRWGDAAEGFLTLFGTKVVFPGIGDRRTLEALSTLVGDWDRPYTTFNSNTGTSTTYGVPNVAWGQNQSTGYSISSRREALLSPSEIANIPPRHALIIRTHRWGLIEATPYFAAAPWPAVLSRVPREIPAGRGPDQFDLRSADPIPETRRAEPDPTGYQ